MKRSALVGLPGFPLDSAVWSLAFPLRVDRVVNKSLVVGTGVTVLAERRFRDAGAAPLTAPGG